MKLDNSKPTLQARLRTAGVLIQQEACDLEGYVPERDLERMKAALLAGWREVMRIKARAAVECMLKAGPGR